MKIKLIYKKIKLLERKKQTPNKNKINKIVTFLFQF